MKTEPLILLSGLERDPAIGAYLRLVEGSGSLAAFCRALYAENAQDDFGGYVAQAILRDDNPFARAAAAGDSVSPYLIRAYTRDLSILYAALYRDGPSSDLFRILPQGAPFAGNWGNAETVEAIRAFHRANGFGAYAVYRAFRFVRGEIVPVERPSEIALSDLKGYAREKQIIEDNLLAFLGNLPYSDMLLYGDRGTGKSSTVHAMLNRYAAQGLRIVELPKEHLSDLTALNSLLAGLPLKFLIFLDDLSLEEDDAAIPILKAALEGGVSDCTGNTMIVATSNRRHIVRESVSERENSLFASDQMHEQLSLSDRFGVTVLFSTTGKDAYLSIVRSLADDLGLALDRDALCALAERWALQKGGRSPRRAKQFVELAYAYVRQGKEITF